jgi:polar amino acid transport system substrate-binding protein
MAHLLTQAGAILGLMLAQIVSAPAAQAQTQVPSDPAVVHSLAPSGTLRVAINLGNSVLAHKDATSGKLSGTSVVLAQELGRRLGVPVSLTPYDAAGKVFDAMEQQAWDVAFLAIEPERATKINFSAPYVFIDGTYLVKAGAPMQHVGDMDKAGLRIAVGRGAAYDLFLSRTLKNAELVRAPTSAAAFDVFKAQGLDAVAGVRQALMDMKGTSADYRVMDDSFTRIEQAIAVPRGKEEGARYIQVFIAEMKRSGAVRRALDADGQTGATVAPP